MVGAGVIDLSGPRSCDVQCEDGRHGACEGSKMTKMVGAGVVGLSGPRSCDVQCEDGRHGACEGSKTTKMVGAGVVGLSGPRSCDVQCEVDAACAATDNICCQREKRLSISHRVRNSARQREKRLSHLAQSS